MSKTLMQKDDLILVTGAGGFIGGHMVRTLRDRGFRHIRAVDRKPFEEWYQFFDDVENLHLNLALLGACQTAAKDADYVFNLACDMGGMGFIELNKALCMLSVLASTHMLVAAKDAGAKRLFYSSSACVYNGASKRIPRIRASRKTTPTPRCRRTATDGRSFFRSGWPGTSWKISISRPGRALPQRLWSMGNL